MKKKFILAAFIAVFTLALTACGGDQPAATPATDAGTTSADTTTDKKDDTTASTTDTTTDEEEEVEGSTIEIRTGSGALVVDSDHVKDATTKRVDSDWWGVVVSFDKQGTKAYQKFAKKNMGKEYMVYMDGDVYDKPTVIKPANVCTIPIFETEADAEEFATKVNNGLK